MRCSDLTSQLTVGDFRQCLAVIPGATDSEIIDATLSNASFWKDIRIFRLTENMCVLHQDMSPAQ